MNWPTPVAITSFSGKWRFLSNFWRCKIITPISTGKVVETSSVENAYQARKFFHIGNPDLELEILQGCSPGEAKRIARENDDLLHPEWTDIKVSVMDALLWQKFHPDVNPTLAKKLLSTENYTLVEGNTWNDTFWGAVWDQRAFDMGLTNPYVPISGWVGKNTLGMLLTLQRNRLRE